MTKTPFGFLFGSGISIPGSFPRTADITNKVISGEGVMRHTDGNYYFGTHPSGIPEEYVPKMVACVKRLKSEIDAYYSYNPSRLTNYEDIYYLASQINDSESGQYDNPAIVPLIDKIKNDSGSLFLGTPHKPEGQWRMIDLTSEVTKYVRDVVWHMLAIQPKQFDHLRFLVDSMSDSSIELPDIFTLNHDTLIEQTLERQGIHFLDGFEATKDSFRLWNPSVFESTKVHSVRLFKLHGSVNWFRFEDRPALTLGIPLRDFWEKFPNEYPVDGGPEILVGTHNKIFAYSGPIYSDLHCLFHKSLSGLTRLVVSGYSFNDKAVNTKIIYWLMSKPTNKMIVVHPNPKSLRSSARFAIQNQLDNWHNLSKLSYITKQIQDATWKEITDQF